MDCYDAVNPVDPQISRLMGLNRTIQNAAVFWSVEKARYEQKGLNSDEATRAIERLQSAGQRVTACLSAESRPAEMSDHSRSFSYDWPPRGEEVNRLKRLVPNTNPNEIRESQQKRPRNAPQSESAAPQQRPLSIKEQATNLVDPHHFTMTSSAGAGANAGYGADFQMPAFMRRGMRGHGWRGMHMGPHGQHHHGQRPEVVSLEGEQARGDSSAHPHHGHGAFWGPPPHPDPPLAPMPSETASTPSPPPHPFGFAGAPPAFEGFASLMGEHARNFYGDLAAQFGPPPPGSPPQRGPMGWRGRRGGGGPWRGRWGQGPPHGHHHSPGPPGHFPHHEHGPIRPKMNIQHTGNVFTVTLELPGLQKGEVDISVAEGILTVSGEFVDNAPDFNILPGYEAEGLGFEMMDDSGTLYNNGQEIDDDMDAMNLNANQTDGGSFVLRERRFGPFKRSIKLPAWVDVDAIKATMAHGVLSLVFEKPEEEETGAPAKKITVL